MGKHCIVKSSDLQLLNCSLCFAPESLQGMPPYNPCPPSSIIPPYFAPSLLKVRFGNFFFIFHQNQVVWTKFLCYIVLHLIVVEACQEGGGVPSPASTCNPPPTLLRTSPPSTLCPAGCSSALLKNFGNKGVSG